VSGWLDTQAVLDWLGLDASGPVLDACVPAAEATVQGWRLADTPADWNLARTTHPHVYLAAVQYAALLYQSNVTPEGFAGFDEAGGIVNPPNAKIVQIRHLARALAPGVG